MTLNILNSVSQKMEKAGASAPRLFTLAVGSSVDQFGAFIRSEVDKWAKNAQAAGIKSSD